MDSPHIPKEGQLLVGPLFNEPMLVETVRPGGTAVWSVGLVGSRTHQFRRVELSENDLGLLRIVETSRSFDGDPQLLKLAIQAYALGIAYEFDPYFGLSRGSISSAATSSSTMTSHGTLARNNED